MKNTFTLLRRQVFIHGSKLQLKYTVHTNNKIRTVARNVSEVQEDSWLSEKVLPKSIYEQDRFYLTITLNSSKNRA